MHLQAQGRKVVLLQSYRDGSGRVRHRRLGELAEDELGSVRNPAWRREFHRQYPQIKVDWERVAEHADRLAERDLPSRRPTTPRRQRIATALKTLLRLLQEEKDRALVEEACEQLELRRRSMDARIDRAEEAIEEGDLEAAEEELTALRVRTMRRTRLEWADPSTSPLLETKALLSRVLGEQGRLSEMCQVQAELVAHCPTPEALGALGVTLHQLGRVEEAAQSYARMPGRMSSRHFNLASAFWDLGRPEEALQNLLRGLTRDRTVGDALDNIARDRHPYKGGEYWKEYGRIWSPTGRQFFMAVYGQLGVKMGLTTAEIYGRCPRNLLHPMRFARVLARALETYAEEPRRRGVKPGAGRELLRQSRRRS